MNNAEITNLITGIFILYFLYRIIKPAIKSFKKQKSKSYYPDKNKANEVTGYNHIDNKPYNSKKILTNNEYSFYIELKNIADEYNLLIFPKVGLKDLFEPINQYNYMYWFGKIAQKHIDFSIFDKQLNILFSIELDDKSHNSESAGKKDNFKDDVFLMNHIKLYRIKAQTSYNKEYISKYI